MRSRRFLIICCLMYIMVLTPAASCFASENSPSEGESVQGSDIPLLSDEQEESLDNLREAASNVLLDTANWIDSFFDDRRYVVEANKTRARLSIAGGYSDKYDAEIRPRFDLRLRLPRLEKKTFVIINATNSDDEFQIGGNNLSARSDSIGDEDNDPTIRLQRFAADNKNYSFSGEVGASTDYVFGGLRYRYLRSFGDWQGRLTNRLRYYTDIGWDNATVLDFETKFTDKLFFRSATAMRLAEEKDGVPHGQLFRLIQVLSEYQAVSYDLGAVLDTEPEYTLTEARFRVNYRQRFYRDWLVLEVAPLVSFEDIHDHDANFGIIVTFEASMGYNTDKDVYKKIFY